MITRKKFGFSCTTCHKQENCTKCHDVNKSSNDKPKTVIVKKSFEEQHKNCISCHSKNDNCSNCHNEKTLEPFDHAKQNWLGTK